MTADTILQQPADTQQLPTVWHPMALAQGVTGFAYYSEAHGQPTTVVIEGIDAADRPFRLQLAWARFMEFVRGADAVLPESER